MTPEQPELRLSDAERQEAIDALGEHLSTGRLTIDEYGDRTALVTAAKTRKELAPIFDDLPDPHPSALVGSLPVISQGMTLAPIPTKDLGERLAPYLVPAAAILALVLFFTVARFWLVFLLPVAAALLAGLAMNRGYGPGR